MTYVWEWVMVSGMWSGRRKCTEPRYGQFEAKICVWNAHLGSQSHKLSVTLIPLILSVRKSGVFSEDSFMNKSMLCADSWGFSGVVLTSFFTFWHKLTEILGAIRGLWIIFELVCESRTSRHATPEGLSERAFFGSNEDQGPFFSNWFN